LDIQIGLQSRSYIKSN